MTDSGRKFECPTKQLDAGNGGKLYRYDIKMPISRPPRPLGTFCLVAALLALASASCKGLDGALAGITVTGLTRGANYGGGVTFRFALPPFDGFAVLFLRNGKHFPHNTEYTDSEVGFHTIEAIAIPEDAACSEIATRSWSYSVVAAVETGSGTLYAVEEVGIPKFQPRLWATEDSVAAGRALFAVRHADNSSGSLRQPGSSLTLTLAQQNLSGNVMVVSGRLRGQHPATPGEEVVLRQNCEVSVRVAFTCGEDQGPVALDLQLHTVRGIVSDSITGPWTAECVWRQTATAVVCGANTPVTLHVHTVPAQHAPALHTNPDVLRERIIEEDAVVRVNDAWRLPSGSALRVRKGVTFLMAPGAAILCDNATIALEGTAEAPIVFAPESQSTQPWAGIVALTGCSITGTHVLSSGSGALRPDLGQLGYGHHAHHTAMFLLFPSSSLELAHSSLRRGSGLVSSGRDVLSSESVVLCSTLWLLMCGAAGGLQAIGGAKSTVLLHDTDISRFSSGIECSECTNQLTTCTLFAFPDMKQVRPS